MKVFSFTGITLLFLLKFAKAVDSPLRRGLLSEVPPLVPPLRDFPDPPFGDFIILPRDSNRVPLCLQDAEGFFIPPNDPRFKAPDAVVIRAESITFDESESAIDEATDALGLISAAADLGSLVPGDVGQFFAIFGKVSTLVSAAITVFGPLGGLETGDEIFQRNVLDGFQQLNTRLTDIQIQLRQEFLNVALLVGDVVLDEIASRIDSLSRAFSSFVSSNTTLENREAYYGPNLRGLCNEPYGKPEDIFFDLYGYACKNCTFAPKKRAALIELAIEKNLFNDVGFMQSFGNFIIRGMAITMFFHTACLPPIDGACVDRSSDNEWKNNIDQMVDAADEVIANIFSIEANISDWVPNLDASVLVELINGLGDNEARAVAIEQFLTPRQPFFFFVVFVDNGSSEAVKQDRNRFLFRRGCSKDAIKCETIRNETGHIFFDDVNKFGVSIFYRNQTLTGSLDFFPNFFQEITDRELFDEEAIKKFLSDGCQRDQEGAGANIKVFFPACAFQCYSCGESEQNDFDIMTGVFYIHRRQAGDTFKVRDAVTDGKPDALIPRFDVVWNLKLLDGGFIFIGGQPTVNTYTFVYGGF